MIVLSVGLAAVAAVDRASSKWAATASGQRVTSPFIFISRNAPASLGWECRDLCLLATPPKRQMFVSVADMSKMLA